MSPLEVKVLPGSILDVDCDALVVNLFEGVTVPGGATGAVDRAVGGAISELIRSGELRGKGEEAVVLHTLGRIRAPRIVVVGLGKRTEFTLEAVRRCSAAACRRARRAGAARVATIVHGAGVGGLEPAAAARATVEGALLGLYRFAEFKHGREDDDDDGPEVKELLIVEQDGAKRAQVTEGVRMGQVMGEAANFARDLANQPGNRLTPTRLAEAAASLADRYEMQCEILERQDMERLGMGLLLGVAQGSAEPPKLIALRYRPDGGAGRPGGPLGLVGKGITFDTGGISLKPSERMEEMKYDMAGAAAVLGAVRAIGELRPAVEVVAVIPATENMPGGRAQRPGDIVRAMNGKTVEIVNTDAEGRLVLADAICYARKLGATALVDVATLTGACVVALGHHYTGLMANDEGLAAEVLAAAARAGERLWRLPFDRDFRRQFRSDVADIKNTGGRAGGAITGGMIVAEFAEGVPWAHLDIAGTAWGVEGVSYLPTSAGATGVAARTLAQLALDRGA